MAGVTSPTRSSLTSSTNSKSTTDAINDIDLGTFLTLMIKELQNQDPLNPMDNKDMLTQLSEIRQVGSTDKLTNTLDSVLLGQNISSRHEFDRCGYYCAVRRQPASIRRR